MLARILARLGLGQSGAPPAPAATIKQDLNVGAAATKGEGASPPPAEPAAVLEYASWELVPPSAWTWPHFRPRELACKGTGKLRLQRRAIDALQALRREVDRPLVIASAYRSPEHNAKVGGAKNSRHMEGDAFDVVMTGHDVAAVAAAAKRAGFRGFGWYPKASPPFLHIDMGAARVWGAPIPVAGRVGEA